MLRLAAGDVFRRMEKLDPSVTGMANDIFSLMRLVGNSSFMHSKIFIEHLLYARYYAQNPPVTNTELPPELIFYRGE